MAVHVLLDASLVVNSVDLSDHVQSITVTQNADDVDVTAMGAVAHAHLPGLRNDEITVTFLQDFASGKVDATLSPLVGSATGVAVVVKPTSAAVGSTNPTYTVTATLFDYQPLQGSVGAADTITATFRPAAGGKIVRAIT